MATYKKVRTGKQLRNSYSLDSVLNDTVKLGKLKFANQAEGLTGIEWHRHMQTHCKIEYIVYMLWDALSCIIQDEKTKDVAISLRSIVGTSDISKIMSNPKQLADDLSFALDDDKVIGSTSPNMTEKIDENIPSLRRWIVTLSADLEYNIGNCIINEFSTLPTNISLLAYDIDVGSAYPTGGIILNISKATNLYELCKIDRFTEAQQRSIGINLTAIKSNALSLAQRLYGFPQLDTLLDDFKKEKIIA